MHLAAHLVLATLGACGPGTLATQERSPGVRRTVYVLEVDLARARAIGWATEDASAAQVVESAGRIVRRRLEAMERSFQLRTDLEQRRIEFAMPQIQPRDRELFEDMLRSLGSCEILFLADEELTSALGLDLGAERKKLETWRGANPDSPLEVFNALDPALLGPHRRLLWIDTNLAGAAGPPQALLLPDKPEDHLGAGSFARSYIAQDGFGYCAIGFELRSSRVGDFAGVTEVHVHNRLGFVLEGKLRSAPTLETRLLGGALIEGRFSQEDCERIAGALTKREGPLRVVEVR